MSKRRLSIRLGRHYYDRLQNLARKAGLSPSALLAKILDAYMLHCEVHGGRVSLVAKVIREERDKVDLTIEEYQFKQLSEWVKEGNASKAGIVRDALEIYFNDELNGYLPTPLRHGKVIPISPGAFAQRTHQGDLN